MNIDGALPKGVQQNSVPPQTKDQLAAEQLGAILHSAACELFQLGQNPIALAASPNRFDDAWNYEWIAVRCGKFFSEVGSYCGQHNLDADIVSAPPEAKAAHGVLLGLEGLRWRDLFQKAFGIDWTDQSLSLVIQDGMTWLVFSSNNCSDDGDPVFTVSASGEIAYFGEAEDRFDWAIQEPVPLVFKLSSISEAGREA